MQGVNLNLHHQQQKLMSLLTAALPKEDSAAAAASSSSSGAVISATNSAVSTSASDEDLNRISALNSVHRAVSHPHNAMLVARSVHFLLPALFKLLSDKSYAVRKTVVNICACVCALTSHPSYNACPSPNIVGSPADRFIGWALPQIADISSDGRFVEIVLIGLNEFFSLGDVTTTERYATDVLRACQGLLEDERTSFNLLRPLLSLLETLSVKFTRQFQPHFADLVDLLLGWALMPDLSEADRCLITNSFLRFQNLWFSNLQFSLGLLLKFLADMEAAVQDSSPATPEQLLHFLAFMSCFVAVLQATTNGILERNLIEHIIEPLREMLQRLLTCLSMATSKFGSTEWLKELSQCLTLSANILKERFANFYGAAVEILFQSLQTKGANLHKCAVSYEQVQMVLQTNFRLMSAQRGALPLSIIRRCLELDMPFSKLRLHPNQLVTRGIAATYLFLLKHNSNVISREVINCLEEELEILRGLLARFCSGIIDSDLDIDDRQCCKDKLYQFGNLLSECEILALIRFDMMILRAIFIDVSENKSDATGITRDLVERVNGLSKIFIEKLNPFRRPFSLYVELQHAILQVLHRLFNVVVFGKCIIEEKFSRRNFIFYDMKKNFQDSIASEKDASKAIFQNLNICCQIIAKALHVSTGLSIKLEALEWVASLCKGIIMINDGGSCPSFSYQDCNDYKACWHTCLTNNILLPVLFAAANRELKVRFQVASVVELLLQAELIDPVYFEAVANVALERLGDTNPCIQNAFRKILSFIAPTAFCLRSSFRNFDCCNNEMLLLAKIGSSRYPQWVQMLNVNHFSQSLRPQQLVCILNFISQRGQVVSSSWFQRLIVSYFGNLKTGMTKTQKDGTSVDSGGISIKFNLDYDVVKKICSTNNLASAWWSIHEAARHCINVRLRTHLGGPTQTFAALERMLLDVTHKVHTDPGQRESSGTLFSGSHLLPMRLLLEFVESLKRQIYNAYEGSAVLAASPSNSVLFFRANRKVCEEWFARICEAMMNASLSIHCDSGTYHYAMTRLQDLRNVAVSSLRDSRNQAADNAQALRTKILNDVLRVVRHASLALCRLHESDAIIGLQKWASSTFSSLLFDNNMVEHKAGEAYGIFGWMIGLSYQAKGQYEKATAHFTNMLQSEEALTSMGADGVQFVIARMIDSYVALADWESLDHWLQELQLLRAKHAGKSYAGALTTTGNEINSIHALARFDAGDVQGAWSYLDLTPQNSSELAIDPRMALHRSEQMLLQAMLRPASQEREINLDLEKAKKMVEDALLVSSIDGLHDAAEYATQLYCACAFEHGRKLNVKQNDCGDFVSFVCCMQQVLNLPISLMQKDPLSWLKILRVYDVVLPESRFSIQLCQQIVKIARKQMNFQLAHRLHKKLCSGFTKIPKDEVSVISSNLHYESVLLSFSEGRWEDALLELWPLVQSLIKVSSVVPDPNNMVKAKACLKFSNWIKQKCFDIHWPEFMSKIGFDSSKFASREVTPHVKDGSSSSEINWISVSRYNLIAEEICGSSIKAAVLMCPEMSKAWLSYASWCFNQARLVPSQTSGALKTGNMFPILNDELSCKEVGMTVEEATKIRTICMASFTRGEEITSESMGVLFSSGLKESKNLENIDSADMLVQRVITMMQSAAGAAGAENVDGESTSSILYAQLLQEFKKMNQNLDKSFIKNLVNELMAIWWTLRKRKVALYGYAVRGFLQYISLSSRINFSNFSCITNQRDINKHGREDWVLKATLHILHILLNYGVELEDTFQQCLRTMSPLPWQTVIPQLFARLSSHPEQKIRKQLETLLVSLAKASPWAIVYPTLVDISAYEGDPSDELHHILDCLVKVHPNLVKDVDLIISELAKITVLWEEQWLSTLQDLHADVIRRIGTLKEEVSRVSENSTLSHTEKAKINAAKYSAMMAPIVVSLERRLASTSRSPETAHEAWFQMEYGEQLKSAITNFKMPPTSIHALTDVWKPFDAIATSLANNQKKSLVYLHDVAPRLAGLASSCAPMPGLEKQMVPESNNTSDSNFQGSVTISSFGEQLVILGTKTKPKKLVVLGSDGQRYTYLLKGREDLRLDARIMQLLQAIDGMLRSDTKTRDQSLVVRYYSVTPISERAGLIQWVENIISIYGVYKAWQQRLHSSQLQTNGNGIPGSSSSLAPVPRPSDMFYGKIIPALKEKGLRRVISRRDWPQEVKRKVLLDLMKETPRQLLYKEIWCASEGIQAFRSKLKRFSGSLAVMSMVGHILGLGDRHLDNILMDFNTGDVVHIDYNVCFDKGLRLKIPEIVPFRLTQVIQAALGLTGIEGAFRANCEAVIDTLRRNKDIILMLLEVFVWDPLVDWMRGDGHDEATIGGEERRGMELAVSLSLFASRVQEIRVPLQEHHDLLLGTLPSSLSALQNLVAVVDKYEKICTALINSEQERTKCALSESSAKSIMSEASNNLEKVRMTYEVQLREFAQAKAVATEASQKASLWIEQHGRILDALRSGSAPELQVICQFSNSPEALSLTAAVLAAGVPLTIVPEPTLAHCRDVDREIAHLTKDSYDAILHAAKSLQSYSLALQQLLPSNYIATSEVNNWAQVLQLSVRQLSLEALSIARRKGAELMAKGQGEHKDAILQNYQALYLKIERLVKEIRKVKEDSSELEASINAENECKAKDRLLANFTKQLQPTNSARKNVDSFSRASSHNKHDEAKDNDESEEKKIKVVTILHVAAVTLYDDVKEKLTGICNSLSDRVAAASGDETYLQNWNSSLPDLEENVERCTLIAGVVNEVHQMSRQSIFHRGSFWYEMVASVDDNWASSFQAWLAAVRNLMVHIVGCAIPETINSLMAHAPSMMQTFGSLSQIRGMVETSLEQLADIEKQRLLIEELDRTYHEKVDELTARKTALEMALEKGRDHLSWEEAEEIASQVETCRTQLDQLKNSWEQRDAHIVALAKKELNVQSALVAAEQKFNSLITNEREGDVHVSRGKQVLATFARSFAELEASDKKFSVIGHEFSLHNTISITEAGSLSFSVLDSVWRISGMLKDHTFFVWKVCITDASLDLCLRNMVSPLDHAVGFDKVTPNQKRKIEFFVEHYVDQYLRQRFSPLLLETLEKEADSLRLILGDGKDVESKLTRKEVDYVKRVQQLLLEYSIAHETARAGKAAISSMKAQVQELTQDLQTANLEAAQLEWLHDHILPPSEHNELNSPAALNEDKSMSGIIKLNRRNILDSIRSAMTAISRATDGLQNIERTAVATEEQLERAMGWACAGPSTGGLNNSGRAVGIPSEFPEHLHHRRQLLWAGQEQASNMLKLCAAVLDFEESRDGFLRTPSDVSNAGTLSEGRAWQQAYMNIISRLDICYRSFTRADHEWHLAQKNMEAATANLSNATSDLCLATMKCEANSEELKAILAGMQDITAKASSQLSMFCRVARSHSALTTETGSMLEEVLAITEGAEGAHDVYRLAKEAAAQHKVLMVELNKVNMLLLPLESMVVSAMNAVRSLINSEGEIKLEISHGQGQTLIHSLHLKLQEVCPILIGVVPMLLNTVKDLHETLTRLARTASSDAGVLHKALEVVGESQEVPSQEMGLERPELDGAEVLSAEQNRDVLETVQGHDECGDCLMDEELLLQDNEESWISPPDSLSLSGSLSSECPKKVVDDEDKHPTFKDETTSRVREEKSNVLYPPHSQQDSSPCVKHDDEKQYDPSDGSCTRIIRSPIHMTESQVGLMKTSELLQSVVVTPEAKLKESVSSLSYDGSKSCNDLCAFFSSMNAEKRRRPVRGQNTYAVSVLKRVEAKLNGREIDANRQFTVSEQVDHLLRQATNIDNLCNMYEGWTPWI